MSFRIARIRFLALSVFFSGSLLVGGCSLQPPQTENLFSEETDTVSTAAAAVGLVAEVLLPWETIEVGIEGDSIVGRRDVRLKRPVAVAARGDIILIVDADQQKVLRFDRNRREFIELVDLQGTVTGDVTDIFLTPNLDFFIADWGGARVLQFDHRGRQIREFRNTLNLRRPVSVSVDDSTGYVFVADGVMDHVVVFNSTGEALTAIGKRGSSEGQFLNITGMARGPEGLYIIARVGDRIQVLGDDGSYRYSLPRDSVAYPNSVVVSDDNLVFVSDFIDNTIKIYQGDLLVAQSGGTGSAPGKFRRITDMWLDEGFIYVADSLNGRIQILRVVKEAIEE
ncbi:MAG: NHL repeat-containing protein [Gammaproteobacteria bacterium]|nr:MAG: NHL repeat-containing protein [Gammaproteobacteria bacterium]TND06229.1 MAG: NHL repeat-containing protein [Gammaproteobacteria bacterium]